VPFTVLDPNASSSTVLGEAEIPWSESLQHHTAIVLDLPATESIQMAILLAKRGYTPVPIFNATPNLSDVNTSAWVAAIDTGEIADALLAATPLLASVALPADSAPVFLLDANRLRGQTKAAVFYEVFDNRWAVFAEDFPASDYLLSHGIKQILLVQPIETAPQSDLAHVLRRWQQAGIEILAIAASATTPAKIAVRQPSVLKTLWYRLMAKFGFRRAALGGLGWLISSGRAAG
jgi:hypothetical protein